MRDFDARWPKTSAKLGLCAVAECDDVDLPSYVFSTFPTAKQGPQGVWTDEYGVKYEMFRGGVFEFKVPRLSEYTPQAGDHVCISRKAGRNRVDIEFVVAETYFSQEKDDKSYVSVSCGKCTGDFRAIHIVYFKEEV